MTKLLILALLMVLTARADIELTGVMSVGTERKVALKETLTGVSSGWLSMGEVFEGNELISMDVAAGELVVEKAGQRRLLKLMAAKAGVAKPVVVDPDLREMSLAELHRRGFHRVVGGQTLMKIAKELGVSAAEVRALNPEVNWARLEVGQVVRYKKTVD